MLTSTFTPTVLGAVIARPYPPANPQSRNADWRHVSMPAAIARTHVVGVTSAPAGQPSAKARHAYAAKQAAPPREKHR